MALDTPGSGGEDTSGASSMAAQHGNHASDEVRATDIAVIQGSADQLAPGSVGDMANLSVGDMANFSVGQLGGI